VGPFYGETLVRAREVRNPVSFTPSYHANRSRKTMDSFA
jgi:hypothetical protein